MTDNIENNLSETALKNIADAVTQTQKKFDLMDTMAPRSLDCRDVEIAETILHQIQSFDPLSLCALGWKIGNVPVVRGILLRNVIVKQTNSRSSWGHVQIILNHADYYDVTAWTKDSLGFPKKVVVEVYNADFTQLWEILRKIWE